MANHLHRNPHHTLWLSAVFEISRQDQDRIEIPKHVLNRLTQAACFPA
jgi:hypothetical protein